MRQPSRHRYSQEPSSSRPDKTYEINHHFIKEKIEEGVFTVSYTPTNCQTADILTKALARSNFDDLIGKLGMINIYNLA